MVDIGLDVLELHIAIANLPAKIWLNVNRAQCHHENLEFFYSFLLLTNSPLNSRAQLMGNAALNLIVQ